MKIISKILYGLISFSVFAAYKIETAWAGWKATLVSYSYGCSGSYNTAAKVHSQLSKFQAQKLTLCQQNQLLKGCTYTAEDGTEQFMNAYSNGDAPGISSLIPLAELCNLKTAECMDCMGNGTMDLSKAKATILRKAPADYKDKITVTICDTNTLTSALAVLQPGMKESDLAADDIMLLTPMPSNSQPMLQTYDVEFLYGENDWLSLNDSMNCYIGANNETSNTSGIFISDKDCPFLHS